MTRRMRDPTLRPLGHVAKRACSAFFAGETPQNLEVQSFSLQSRSDLTGVQEHPEVSQNTP